MLIEEGGDEYSHSPYARSAKDSQADGEQCPKPHVAKQLVHMKGNRK